VFDNGKTPLIVNSVGEHIVTQAEHSPFIFHNSLNYWQSNMATGTWASESLGRKAFIASSFNDSGYDSVLAFSRGFEGNGGEIVGIRTTHMIPDDDGMASLFEAIEEANPDFVYGLYTGNQAVEFVRAYSRSELGGRVPLAGSAFMVDESILPSHGGAAGGIVSALTWSGDLQTPENSEFTTAYKTRTGRLPSAFSVLGYDSARLISEGLRAVEGDASRSVQFIGALARAEFDSPRGHVTMNPRTQTTTSPIYLRKVGSSGNQVIARLNQVPETEDLGLSASGMRSGWKNAYLTI
jgi:branched-chain amino acid transport system substrate-binding protein